MRNLIILAGLLTLFLSPWNAHAASFSKSQITDMVEPIALYPDPLLQQILPASTFPDQIADASLLIRTKEDAELIKDQSWDESVKIIATYPGVLKMMYTKLDWTTDLGNAFLNQNKEVLDAIQNLRTKAQSHGNLKTSEGQTVKTEKAENGDTYITIQPSDPQVVYVPQETSSTVYTQPVESSTSSALVPIASFGIGMAVGAMMSDDDDDHYYYGGYGGPIYGGSPYYNDWAETRRARNEDIHDQVMNRQDFRHDQRADRQDFRQDYAKENPGQINRENLSQARTNAQNNQTQRRETAQANRGTGQNQQKLNDAKASMKSRDFGGSRTTQQTRSYDRSTSRSSGSFSGSGGSSYSNRASTRGSTSRSMSGSSSFGGSRGGFSGGGRGGGGRGGRR